MPWYQYHEEQQKHQIDHNCQQPDYLKKEEKKKKKKKKKKEKKGRNSVKKTFLNGEETFSMKK